MFCSVFPQATRLNLSQLATRAANELGLDPNNVSDAVAKREALGSTGVGYGVALPHARVSHLKMPFGLLARLKHSVDFEAVDDQPVDIVFLLLMPEAADSVQLNALACIARKLRDPETLRMFVGRRIARAFFTPLHSQRRLVRPISACGTEQACPTSAFWCVTADILRSARAQALNPS